MPLEQIRQIKVTLKQAREDFEILSNLGDLIYDENSLCQSFHEIMRGEITLKEFTICMVVDMLLGGQSNDDTEVRTEALVDERVAKMLKTYKIDE